MRAVLKADGRTVSNGSAYVMHSERLVDPLDSFVQAIAELSKKTKTTLDDKEELGRREFFGGMYTNPPMEWPLNGHGGIPSIPNWNILRCLQDGGKRHKRGADVLRGIYPLEDYAALQYDGPKDPVEMWKDGSFALRKSVGIRGNRVIRVRPIFHDWQFELPVEIDGTILDTGVLRTIWKEAGRYCGIGEMRPVFGRFTGTIEVTEQ